MIFHPPSRFFSAPLLQYFMLRLSRCRLCNHLSTLSEDESTQQSYPSMSSILKPPINQETGIYRRLLTLCDTVESLKQIHSLLTVHGLTKDESLVIEILRICFHLNIPDHGLSVFHSVEKPTLFLRNSMLRLLSDYGLYGDLLVLYVKLNSSGCVSDNFTFPFVIKACAAVSDLRAGKEVHSAVLRTGFQWNVVLQTTLVDMYAKLGCVEASRRVFDGISQRDLICWNALLSGFSWNGLHQETFDAFRQILQTGLKPNASTFVSVIPACSRLGCLRIGKSIHAFIVRSGIPLDESLAPAMMSMYVGCEDLSAAQLLFCLLPTKDVVAFNAMIAAYTQNREFDKAFEVFCQMHRTNINPCLVTLVSILPYCANLAGVQYGESVHACSIKLGFEHQFAVSTALLTMYAKLGDLDSAELLFYGMAEKNLLSWNSMVSGYFRNGLYDIGLAAFRKMQLKGVRPDSVSMVSVLSASAKLGDLFVGKAAHAFSIRNGFDSNLNVLNALLIMYSDCDQLSTSLKLFRKMQVRNMISWNSLISGCVKNGDMGTVAAVLCQMQKEKMKFDLITLISILPMYSQVESMAERMSIHGHAVKFGYVQDISFVNALLSMYISCGDLDAGRLLFENMAMRDVVSWNALMTGYRSYNLFAEVMILFNRMIMESQRPNYITLLNVLPTCKSQLQGKSIHAYALRTAGCLLEFPLVTSLMCMYDRFENLNACCSLFEMGDKWNVVLWNAVMSAHARTKHANNALVFFRKMLQMGIEPDTVSVLNLVSACVQLASLDSAHCTMAYIFRKGFDNSILVANALIDMYTRCGSIQTAEQLFYEIQEKDAVTWSVMINGYGMHGDGAAALALFSQMKIDGVVPDDITFIGVLSACAHAGLVDQGRMLFHSMTEQHQIQPRIEHYACMVDLLGRTGFLDEAYDLVKRMPFKPSASVLESLLGASCVHGNIELAEQVGRLLFQLDHENSRVYVMLSNAYAAVGRWSDASRLRTDMEGRGLRKVPGFSIIEANSHVDGSLVGD